MSEIFDLLKGQMGQTLIDGASNQLGMNKQQAGTALQTALPLILGAMKNNAEGDDGQGLLNALGNSKHDGSILDKLGSVMGGDHIDDDVMQDGAGILGHLFAGKQDNVAAAVSKTSGVDAGKAMNILKVAAPVVMGFLGKQQRQTGVADTNGLGSMLGRMLGGESQQSQSMVTRLLDANGDGSIIDDVAGMFLNSGSKKSSGGGLFGNILGGLFGGK